MCFSFFVLFKFPFRFSFWIDFSTYFKFILLFCGFFIDCLYVLLLFMICLSHLIMRNVFLQNVALSLVLLTTNYIDSCIFMHRFQCFSLISPGFWKSSQRFTCLCANVCVLFCFVVFQFICLNLRLGDKLFLGLCFHCFFYFNNVVHKENDIHAFLVFLIISFSHF